jgi:putative transposase
MTKRDAPFIVGEWYHCYNLGIEKRTVFENVRDYYRFLELLYLANDEFPLRHSDVGTRAFEDILKIPRGKKLVTIGAFCLMPNHFHLVLQEVSEGGITTFMRKIGTAYTLYFNTRNERTGNLFLKPFRSRHAPAGNSFQCLISYVHCSPTILHEPEWETKPVVDPQFLGEQLAIYPYSSLGIYTGARAPLSPIVDTEALALTRTSRIQKMLQEARQYYTDFHPV